MELLTFPMLINKVNNKYLKSYDPKQESKHIISLEVNNLYGYAMYKFLPTSGFKWIDPKEFDLDKYSSNSSKWCFLQEVDLEYPKELRELHNDYPLAPDKIEIKRELLSDYQLKIADRYNIPIGNVKKLVPNFFDKEKYVIHYENLQLYLRLGLKLKKNTSRIRIQSISMAKTICWIQHTKKNRSRKKWWQRWKSVVQINEQCCIWKNNGKLKK